MTKMFSNIQTSSLVKYLNENFLFPVTVFTKPRENFDLASDIFLSTVLLLLVASLPLCSPKNYNGFILCLTSNLSQRSKISSFLYKNASENKLSFSSLFSPFLISLPIGIPYQMQTFSVPASYSVLFLCLSLHSSLPFHLPTEQSRFHKYKVKYWPQTLKPALKTRCNQLLGKDTMQENHS